MTLNGQVYVLHGVVSHQSKDGREANHYVSWLRVTDDEFWFFDCLGVFEHELLHAFIRVRADVHE